MLKEIAFLICITILLASCKKDIAGTQVVDLITASFDDEALAYVKLPLHKYFIYKDSATGTLDSAVVTQSDVSLGYMPAHSSTGIFDPGTSAFYYPTFLLTLTTYNGNSTQEWFYGIASFPFKSQTTIVPLELRQRERIANADKNYVFRYPFTNYAGLLSITVLPSLIVEGKIYNNIVEYVEANGTDPNQSYYLKSTYYWAKGIGIIKRELRKNNSIKTDLLVRNG